MEKNKFILYDVKVNEFKNVSFGEFCVVLKFKNQHGEEENKEMWFHNEMDFHAVSNVLISSLREFFNLAVENEKDYEG